MSNSILSIHENKSNSTSSINKNIFVDLSDDKIPGLHSEEGYYGYYAEHSPSISAKFSDSSSKSEK